MFRFALVLGAVLMCSGAGNVVAAQAQRPANSPPASPASVLNLNSATATQLAELPGIGIKTAELIVQYRGKNGPFKKAEELMNIRGIGEKSFLRIKDLVTVAAPKGDVK